MENKFEIKDLNLYYGDYHAFKMSEPNERFGGRM